MLRAACATWKSIMSTYAKTSGEDEALDLENGGFSEADDLAAGGGEPPIPDHMEASDDSVSGDADVMEGHADVEADGVDGPSGLPAPRLSTSLAAGRDNLHVYLREISKFPLLNPDEEFELARKVRDHGDQRAAFRLVTSHLRLVVKIAMDFQRRWAQNVADLIQEGNVGLMRAVKKYDPEKGIKFSYYAAYWIKAYILKYIMDNWRLVRIGTTQAQRTLFYNLNKERQRLTSLGFDPSAANISKNLKVSESDVLEMDQRMARNDLSLDLTLGDDSTSTRLDYLPALTPGIEEMLAKDEIAGLVDKHLQTIMPELSDKERDLLEQRILSDSPVTLREIGVKYGITRERVRQIETRLLEKIRDHFTKRIDDFSSEWIRKEE
jgi:RNA polymerase sigma-32 factor